MTGSDTSPQYNVAKVEAVILEMVVELHPEDLSTEGLLLKILSNSDDGKEIETGVRAIRRLRELGLFKERDDEIVEPTQAALRAVALLTC